MYPFGDSWGKKDGVLLPTSAPKTSYSRGRGPSLFPKYNSERGHPDPLLVLYPSLIST